MSFCLTCLSEHSGKRRDPPSFKHQYAKVCVSTHARLAVVMAADAAQLVATLRSLQLDSLSDEECDMLQVGLSAVQQALDERSSSRSHLCSEALRVILPICESYYPAGGSGASGDNALALALTCAEFRDAVFEHFPRDEDGIQIR